MIYQKADFRCKSVSQDVNTIQSDVQNIKRSADALKVAVILRTKSTK